MIYDWTIGVEPAVPHRKAYAVVETEARKVLACVPEALISTNELVARLTAGLTPNSLVVKRIYKALAALSTRGLADCVTKGEPVKRKFGMIRPNLWHKPTQATVCAGCGRPL